jgi:lysophospholipase L1-like esterase
MRLLLLPVPALLALLVTASAARPYALMPLGDSITRGSGPPAPANGYRGPLYALLLEEGHDVDLVGGLTDGDFADPQHEGHAGWQADLIGAYAFSWLASQPADIVLLHAGTNDISASEPPHVVALQVMGILDAVDDFELVSGRDVVVVLALLVGRANPASAEGVATSALNDELAAMAQARIDAGDLLLVVDMEAALLYPDDMADSTHPNEAGYAKMAAAWLPEVAYAAALLAQPCADGLDNDGDGQVDYPDDAGCRSAAGLSEEPDCDDGIDNDRDGWIDYPADPACRNQHPLSSEDPDAQCNDGVDNDEDGAVDYPADPECAGPWDHVEAPLPACGLVGIEAAGMALLLGCGRRRRSGGRGPRHGATG